MMAAVVVPSAAHIVSGPSATLQAAIQSPRQFKNSMPDHASFDVAPGGAAELDLRCTGWLCAHVSLAVLPSIVVHEEPCAREP
jgi:hypothetical protein